MGVILLFFGVLLGSWLGTRFRQDGLFAKGLLIFSAGFLITVTVNEVFPQIFSAKDSSLGYFLLGGVLLQMVLENLTKGFEHGHIHHPSDTDILPAGLLLGLFVHAFLEGLPIKFPADELTPYIQGILVHNIPISFILGAFLFKTKRKNFYPWLILIFFAAATPLGSLTGEILPKNWILPSLAIVGGIFLHISSVIIFESNKNHNVNWAKMLWVIAGIASASVLHIFHHH